MPEGSFLNVFTYAIKKGLRTWKVCASIMYCLGSEASRSTCTSVQINSSGLKSLAVQMHAYERMLKRESDCNTAMCRCI